MRKIAKTFDRIINLTDSRPAIIKTYGNIILCYIFNDTRITI